MKKAVALVFATVLLVSAGSSAMIPGNISINLNIDLFGDDTKDKQQKKKENTTYGERKAGQAVHTKKKPNDPEVQRNTQEYGVTEEDTNENNDIGEMISAFFSNLFGKPEKAPDTSQPNSVY